MTKYEELLSQAIKDAGSHGSHGPHGLTIEDVYISSYNGHYTLMTDSGEELFPSEKLLLAAIKERDNT